MILLRASNAPALITTWVYESSPVTIFPIALKHGTDIAMFSWESN